MVAEVLLTISNIISDGPIGLRELMKIQPKGGQKLHKTWQNLDKSWPDGTGTPLVAGCLVNSSPLPGVTEVT